MSAIFVKMFVLDTNNEFDEEMRFGPYEYEANEDGTQSMSEDDAFDAALDRVYYERDNMGLEDLPPRDRLDTLEHVSGMELSKFYQIYIDPETENIYAFAIANESGNLIDSGINLYDQD